MEASDVRGIAIMRILDSLLAIATAFDILRWQETELVADDDDAHLVVKREGELWTIGYTCVETRYASARLRHAFAFNQHVLATRALFSIAVDAFVGLAASRRGSCHGAECPSRAVTTRSRHSKETPACGLSRESRPEVEEAR